jgi:glutathione S-transferase
VTGPAESQITAAALRDGQRSPPAYHHLHHELLLQYYSIHYPCQLMSNNSVKQFPHISVHSVAEGKTQTGSQKNDLVLYGSYLSQPTRSVIQLCIENDLKFNLQVIRPMAFQPGQQEFLLKFNPQAQTPVLHDGDFILYESNAILQYLCNKYALNNWYPTDLITRALCDQYLHFHHIGVRAILRGIRFAAEKKNFLAKAPNMLNVLETRYFQYKNKQLNYLVSYAEPTIADLQLLNELGPAHSYSFDQNKYPRLAAWRERMENRPASKEMKQRALQYWAQVQGAEINKNSLGPSKL